MSEETYIQNEVTLGSVSFELPGEWRLGEDVPFNKDNLSPDLFHYVDIRLRAFDKRIEFKLGGPVWIDDIYLSDGSVVIRSKLVTTAAVLVVLNQGYDLVSKYEDFEAGAIKIIERIESAADFAAKAMPDAVKFQFVPAEPLEMREDLIHGRRVVKGSRPKGYGR
ncbi:hypothetical protein [Ensifer sp. YR511]|uniref:hypothetical protein n=1 Tax=Ensifer sp. YR511 TaxID=1855294 RepID=UPI00087F66C0|nr:hypothetical protein [Ensifer sp. YR511]SDN84502.1 hypothetical protein SAMN05216328_13934 [Ensifer sp. YR511]